MSKAPEYLQKGDLVLLLPTARKTSPETLRPALSLLGEWGLETALAPNIYASHNQFAGSDEERAAALQWALDHPTAAAIIATSGGYGTLRIIDQVNFKKFTKRPKWFAGYSDVTVLHSRLHHLGLASIHSTMAFQFGKDPGATLTLKNALFGKRIAYSVPSHPLNRTGTGEAEIVGGNLSLIYALSGSVDDLQTKNKILFIEDLDEYLYHIDRMMLQLKRSGKLRHLKGLIVGGLSDMKDNTVPFGKTAEEIVWDAVKEYDYPVCFGFPAGHVMDNRALYLGRKASLEVGRSKVRLSFV